MQLRVRILGLILVLLCVSAPFAAAQGEPHAIVGTVKDSEGAVIEGATVILTNQRTHDTLTNTSDSQGRYYADLSAMPNAFQTGDIIDVEANAGNLSGSSSITVSANAFDQCDIVVEKQVIQNDSMWTFLIPILIVSGIVLTALLGIILSRKPKASTENKKGRRRH